MDLELEKLVSAGKIGADVGGKLSSLAPGTFCEHKSWGVGRIRDWDLVGDQMRDLFDAQVTNITTFDHSNEMIQFNYMFEKGERHYPEPMPFSTMMKRFIGSC